MTTGFTADDLVADLRALGVASGGILFVHSSFKSLGPVQGGADAVIAALEEANGPDGLLLMPAFNLVKGDGTRPKKEVRSECWDPATTPSTVGYLTEFFRTMPGTFRSDHYSHSVAARGRGAEAFVADHRSREGMESGWDLEPWGRTFGTHSPMVMAYERGGLQLFIGTDYRAATFAHLAEVIVWNRWCEHKQGPEPGSIDRMATGERYDREGEVRFGQVGEADCRLLPMRDYVDRLVAWTEEDLQKQARPSAMSFPCRRESSLPEGIRHDHC